MTEIKAALAIGHSRENDIFHALDKDTNEIRLMRMQHDDRSAIHCVVETFPLAESPTYTALSYCWTTSPPTCTIQLNGQVFNVRPNLYAYLKQLQDERNTDWHFIDAICVNQADMAERQAQVALMGRLYRDAHQVVTWLGVDSSEYDKDLPNLRQLCDNEETLKAAIDEFEGPDSNETLRQLFMIFLTSQYWTRLWIVQELLLARRLIFRYSSMILKSEILEMLINQFMWKEDWGPGPAPVPSILLPALRPQMRRRWKIKNATTVETVLIASSILDHRKRWRSAEPEMEMPGLVGAIAICIGQRCEILHDKVFGMLGLREGAFRADYSMSIIELYLHTLVAGLLELFDLENSPEFEERFSLRQREHIVPSLRATFSYYLRKGLGLSLTNSAVRVGTRRALVLCGIPPDQANRVFTQYAQLLPRKKTEVILSRVLLDTVGRVDDFLDRKQGSSPFRTSIAEIGGLDQLENMVDTIFVACFWEHCVHAEFRTLAERENVIASDLLSAFCWWADSRAEDSEQDFVDT